MKNLLAVLTIVTLTGCRLDETVAPNTINLGVTSNVLAVVATPASPITAGPYSITVDVTPGATYSFQLTHINGSILHNKGFTATSSHMTISMDYSNVENGAHDLNLMDNTGRVLKVPVIVQH